MEEQISVRGQDLSVDLSDCAMTFRSILSCTVQTKMRLSRSCGRLELLCVISFNFELDFCSEQDQNVATVKDGFISTNAVLAKVA